MLLSLFSLPCYIKYREKNGPEGRPSMYQFRLRQDMAVSLFSVYARVCPTTLKQIEP